MCENFLFLDEMLQENFPSQSDRAPRDYRVKFPDDILHDSLPGQLWFGAEVKSDAIAFSNEFN